MGAPVYRFGGILDVELSSTGVLTRGAHAKNDRARLLTCGHVVCTHAGDSNLQGSGGRAGGVLGVPSLFPSSLEGGS